MGYPAKNDVDAEVFLRSLTDKERSRRLLAVLVVNHGRQPVQIPVNVETGHSHKWRLVREGHEIAETVRWR